MVKVLARLFQGHRGIHDDTVGLQEYLSAAILELADDVGVGLNHATDARGDLSFLAERKPVG